MAAAAVVSPELADELHRLCGEYRAARRPGPKLVRDGEPIAATPFVLRKLSEIPPASASQDASYKALRDFGQRLYDQGGVELMVATFDDVAEQHGYRGVFGANGAWNGIGNAWWS